MAHRRRPNNVPISLFSFQDIMTSVMGILIFVTLMMATHLTRAVATAAKDAPSSEETAAARKPTRQLSVSDVKRREREARGRYEEALQQTLTSAGIAGDPNSDVASRRAKLETAQRRLRELDARVADAVCEIEKMNKPGESRRVKLDQIVAMEQQANQLQARLLDRLGNPKLTYIIQVGQTKTPILLEMSKTDYGLGSTDENDVAVWFGQPDRELRLDQLMSWLQTRDAGKEYVVILLKPSAFGPMYDQTISRLKKAQFEVGTDILPEDAAVLRRPSAP